MILESQKLNNSPWPELVFVFSFLGGCRLWHISAAEVLQPAAHIACGQPRAAGNAATTAQLPAGPHMPGAALSASFCCEKLKDILGLLESSLGIIP